MKTKWLRPSEALSRFFIHPESDKKAADQETVIRRLGFRIGDLGLLIAENTFSELTDYNAICNIPNTSSWFLGLVNLRGNLVPVFELKMLLGLERGGEKKRMLLILEQGDAAAGIPIDELPAHQYLNLEDKLHNLPALPSAIQPFIPSGFERNGEMWFNFDHKAFFESLGHRVAT